MPKLAIDIINPIISRNPDNIQAREILAEIFYKLETLIVPLQSTGVFWRKTLTTYQPISNWVGFIIARENSKWQRPGLSVV